MYPVKPCHQNLRGLHTTYYYYLPDSAVIFAELIGTGIWVRLILATYVAG